MFIVIEFILSYIRKKINLAEALRYIETIKKKKDLEENMCRAF